MKDKEYLIKFLLDKTVDTAARDDCAMDLADYDSEDVLLALYKCASDLDENYVIQSSCGESLAEIMVRTSTLKKKYTERLSKLAESEFKRYIMNKKPEWLAEL